jgi:acyl carrier protein
VAIEENVIIPMYGGCVCIPSDEQRLSNLPGVMQTMEINWADLTPTVARLLSPENAPFIRTLVLGGESLTKDIIDTWAGIDNIKLFNTYGPSECSIQCTSSKALGRVATGANIGRPVNCKLWVVDADDPHRLLPVGATGELLIEGHIVGRGYLNQAAKTEAAFIQGLPWATADGEVDGLLRRFYRTGDLAKFNQDGTLDCLGRQDSQIKLHGQRIELGEIEYNITKRLAVPDAAQVAVEAFSPGGSSRKLLAAFIQFAETDNAYSAGTPSSSPSGLAVMEMHDDLRKELLRIKSETAQHLPVYMIPSLIVPLHLMPTNTSGKIDRKKLREQAGKFDPRRLALYSLSETVQLAPRETEIKAQVPAQTSFSSPTERALAALWAETMGIDLAETPIGPDDSFLELGGDSITAMQLVGKAMTAGLGLSVSRILKAPTLRDMAAAAVVTDERALLALEAPELSESESEPQTSFSSPAERGLAALWAETMGIDLTETPIGPDDSFLELGGDSITAMQLVGKATAAGLGLSVSHILRAPKLRDMAAAAVVSDERALLALEAPGLSPVAGASPLPTTNDFAQLPLTLNTAIPSEPVSPGSNSPWMTPPETPFTDLAYFPFQLISTKASVADVMTMVATKCNLGHELIQDVYPATPLQGTCQTSVSPAKRRC